MKVIITPDMSQAQSQRRARSDALRISRTESTFYKILRKHKQWYYHWFTQLKNRFSVFTGISYLLFTSLSGAQRQPSHASLKLTSQFFRVQVHPHVWIKSFTCSKLHDITIRCLSDQIQVGGSLHHQGDISQALQRSEWRTTSGS